MSIDIKLFSILQLILHVIVYKYTFVIATDEKTVSQGKLFDRQNKIKTSQNDTSRIISIKP